METLVIDAAGWQAVLAPEDGGGITALRVQGHDILVPAPAASASAGRSGPSG